MSIQPWSKEGATGIGPVPRPWTGIYFNVATGQTSLGHTTAGLRRDAISHLVKDEGRLILVAVLFGHHGDQILPLFVPLAEVDDNGGRTVYATDCQL